MRLVVELAIARATFGSEFADVDWSELERFVPPVHASQRASGASEVAAGHRHLAARCGRARWSARWSRTSAASRLRRSADATRDIYLDLALSKKGVCRHRAFAFLVTALNLGIPARMVVNEAHAWVEVFDGTLWHRIDLGGAALNLDQQDDPGGPVQAAADPYAWPRGPATPGRTSPTRARGDRGGRPGNTPGNGSSYSGAAPSSPGADPGSPDPHDLLGTPPSGSAAPGDPAAPPPPDPNPLAVEAAVRLEAADRPRRAAAARPG